MPLSSNSRNNCTNPVLSQQHTQTQMGGKFNTNTSHLSRIQHGTCYTYTCFLCGRFVIEVNDLRWLKHQRTCFNQTHSCVWNGERSISMLIQMIRSSTISIELDSLSFIVIMMIADCVRVAEKNEGKCVIVQVSKHLIRSICHLFKWRYQYNELFLLSHCTHCGWFYWIIVEFQCARARARCKKRKKTEITF